MRKFRWRRRTAPRRFGTAVLPSGHEELVDLVACAMKGRYDIVISVNANAEAYIAKEKVLKFLAEEITCYKIKQGIYSKLTKWDEAIGLSQLDNVGQQER